MVRGISDYADESKSATDNAGWQPRAAANAAAFATALAAVLAAELDAGPGTSSRSRTGGTGRGGPANIAFPNARVGVQGENVTVHGGIQLGGPHSSSGTADFAAKEGDKPVVRPGKLRLALSRTFKYQTGARNLTHGKVSAARKLIWEAMMGEPAEASPAAVQRGRRRSMGGRRPAHVPAAGLGDPAAFGCGSAEGGQGRHVAPDEGVRRSRGRTQGALAHPLPDPSANIKGEGIMLCLNVHPAGPRQSARLSGKHFICPGLPPL
jgi:hypothetical protein